MSGYVTQRTAPVVTTVSGPVRGHASGGVTVFSGIPFAASPDGTHRWQPPRPATSWIDTLQADAPGPIAPQAPSLFDEMLFPGRSLPQSEDCLTLNIWTPSLNGQRPVMVWVHGGGFTIGAGSQPLYDGHALALAGDVVVISLNYRLGALGFLRLDGVTDGRLPSTGNEGLLDIVAALHWTQEHAERFGGDPGNVTLFGESAGAMATGALLAMPAARGLFHKAILQSGAAHTAATAAAADLAAERFLAHAGVPADDPGVLYTLPVERLLAAQQQLLAEAPRVGLGFLPLKPVVDGDLLPKRLIAAISDGSARDVILMAGTTADEWTLFASLNPQLANLDAPDLRRRLAHLFHDDEISVLLPIYKDFLVQRGIEPTPAELLMAIQGDAWFRTPCERLLAAQAVHRDDSHAYLFDWQARHSRMRSCHSIELGFVFGTRDRSFHGHGPAAERLEASVQRAWTAFAHTGRPRAGSLGEWPAWQPEAPAVMTLGAAPHVATDDWQARGTFWDGIDDTRLSGF